MSRAFIGLRAREGPSSGGTRGRTRRRGRTATPAEELVPVGRRLCRWDMRADHSPLPPNSKGADPLPRHRRTICGPHYAAFECARASRWIARERLLSVQYRRRRARQTSRATRSGGLLCRGEWMRSPADHLDHLAEFQGGLEVHRGAAATQAVHRTRTRTLRWLTPGCFPLFSRRHLHRHQDQGARHLRRVWRPLHPHGTAQLQVGADGGRGDRLGEADACERG